MWIGENGLKQLIERIKGDMKKYLPLTGGTITGKLAANQPIDGDITGKADMAEKLKVFAALGTSGYNTNVGYWYKIATIRINEMYADKYIFGSIICHYNSTNIDSEKNGEIKYLASVKQQLSLGNFPQISLSILNYSTILPDDLVLVVTNNTTDSTEVELWCRNNRSYCVHDHIFYVLGGCGRGDITINPNMTLQQTPPTGTGQYVKGVLTANVANASTLSNKSILDFIPDRKSLQATTLQELVQKIMQQTNCVTGTGTIKLVNANIIDGVLGWYEYTAQWYNTYDQTIDDIGLNLVLRNPNTLLAHIINIGGNDGSYIVKQHAMVTFDSKGLISNVANADTLDGKHASDFLSINGGVIDGFLCIRRDSEKKANYDYDRIDLFGEKWFKIDIATDDKTIIYSLGLDAFDTYGSGIGVSNNSVDLGSISSKWKNIYAVNGTIQTSDRNKKTDIMPLSDELIKSFIMGLAPSSYKMIDGTSGRTHWGLISQDIEKLMNNLGIDSTDFAGFIKSPKVIIHDVDEDGNPLETPVKEVIKGKYEYSLRYDEFIAPLIKMVQIQQSEIETLKSDKAQLEEQLAKAEEQLARIEERLEI